MKTNYISIKSVLYDLSLLVDERYWNEIKMKEWALKALRQVATPLLLQDKVDLLWVESHKAVLPCDFKYLNQIAYTSEVIPALDTVVKQQEFPNTSWHVYSQYASCFKPMRLSTSTFHESLCVDPSINKCPNCVHEYSISPDLHITTTLKEGCILVSYKAYVSSEDDFLIPDNETLKECLTHACLYKYWMSKYQMKEDGAESRMQFHLRQWGMLNQKTAGELNMPDIGELENIKSQWLRLVPRSEMATNFFSNLNYDEQLSF
jgi:hypothetical protein